LNESNESAIDLGSKELDYRRDKEWNIFSWCSSILVAITGGAIALQVGQPNKLVFSQRMIVSFAVVVLVGYSVLWLSYNHKMEKQARHSFDEHISKNILSSKSTSLVNSSEARIVAQKTDW
jgi:hypothetical protein